jgi:DNA-binding phage protein
MSFIAQYVSDRTVAPLSEGALMKTLTGRESPELWTVEKIPNAVNLRI